MYYLKSRLLFFSLLSFSLIGFSQKPAELLSKWAIKSPIEKVYLHVDREIYLAGETIWFKAYLLSEHLPDTISTVLYVELINEKSDIISRKILPVLLGSTNGQFDLPDSLYSGKYIIQAYSAAMLNNGKEFVFRKKIFIYGKKRQENTAEKKVEQETKIQFFPEGGNLVTGLSSTIAFKATNGLGFPLKVSGFITDEGNNKITSFNTVHDGLGMFELKPESNKKYYAWLNDDKNAKFELPVAENNGVVLTIIPHPLGSFFEIFQKITNPLFKAAYMVGQIQHQIVFYQNLNQEKEHQQGILNTRNIKSGIMQVTIFNKEGVPLAERLCFVNNKEYLQKAEIRFDTINLNEKGRNHFKIIIKDTVQGNLSVSVADADFEAGGVRNETIISSFLLSSDLSGYIHNPSWYFSNNNIDSVNTALDLVMMTNGWRRFKWAELAKKVNEPLPFLDPVYISITGKINSQGTKKAFAEKQIMAIISAEGLGKSMQLVYTDKHGNFKIDSLLFFGKGRILFIDTRGKKSQFIDVVLTGDSINKMYNISIDNTGSEFENENNAVTRFQSDYEIIQKAAGIMLEEVKIKVTHKTPTQLLDEKYTSGMFGGVSGRTIDLVNTDEYMAFNNIFDYLVSRVPGLDFVSEDGAFTIYYRQGPSASSMGPIPMVVYLNEVETDASIIATLPAQEIALVKVYNYLVGAAGNGAGGALSIYTRKNSDVINSSKGDFINYQGFSVVKEFYVPDYKADPSLFFKPDNRITLAWRPNIFVNNINPVIPVSFYNSDRTKKFKVIVEGVTTSGKLISLEKIIEAK